MINFQKISLADKALFDKHLAEDDENMYERSFSTIFLYRKLFQAEYAMIAGCIVWRCQYASMKESVPFWTYSYPIGAGDKKAAIEVIMQLCQEENIPLNMNPISEENRQELMDWFSGQFFIESNRDHFDYLYSREKLANLKGKKMQKKRNHIARFKDDPDWQYEPLTQDNLVECFKMAKQWVAARADKWNEDMDNEFGVLQEAFANFQELGLAGGVLRRHGDIVGFTMGEPINSDTYVVHFEKAFPDVHGAYTMINQQFNQQATEGFTYINRADDMGDMGLRKAKLSYYPEILLTKYMAETSPVLLADPHRHRQDIQQIWQECFGDSPELIDFYIQHRMDENNMLAIVRDGHIVSMASFLPGEIQTETGVEPALYVYAVATLPAYQGQGLAGEILAFAKKHWQKNLVLVPATASLVEFYQKRGFVAMYSKQKHQLQLPETVLSCDDRFVLTATSTPKEYKAIRDNYWGGQGYYCWDQAGIAYAMEYAGFNRGESLLIANEEEEYTNILMYDIFDNILRIIETTLSNEALQDYMPQLLARIQERHPAAELTEVQYQQCSCLISLAPKSNINTKENHGYFGLCLD